MAGMRIQDDSGLKGIELSAVLLLVGMLIVLAIPLAGRIGDQVAVLSEAADVRADAFETLVGVDEPVVAGIQLTRSADGAECRWLASEAGVVNGTWRLGTEWMSGRFAAVPQECPTADEVAAIGFGS